MKCSRRIRPIVSTVNIPPHHSLRIKASSATGQPWGVNFGRRSPDSGGQNCTPNDNPGIVDPILDDTDLLLTIDISLASDRCHTPASSAPSRRKSKGPSLASTGSRHDPTHSRAHFQLVGRLEPRQIATDEVDDKPTSSLDMPGKKKPRRSEA